MMRSRSSPAVMAAVLKVVHGRAYLGVGDDSGRAVIQAVQKPMDCFCRTVSATTRRIANSPRTAGSSPRVTHGVGRWRLSSCFLSCRPKLKLSGKHLRAALVLKDVGDSGV